jgi:hypothetical protein
VEDALGWERLGATHVSVTTMGAGLATVDDHIASLAEFKRLWDSR